MTRTLTVVSAGLREPSSSRLLADRLAAATAHAIRTQERRTQPSSAESGGGADSGESDVKIDVIELRDHAHDITNHLLTGFPSPALRETLDALANADGLIAVTPIFAASYSGLFKSFFDIVEPDTLDGMPVLIGATGGTERHTLALEHVVRPLFTYLHAVVVPTSVYAATSDWGAGDDQAAALTDRIERAADELATVITGRRAAQRRDPFTDVTPFEQLLEGDV